MKTETLQKDYEMKVNFYKDHLSRIWTRFNYFITIQTALAGAKAINFQKGNEIIIIDKNLVLLAMAISALWFIIGLTDRGLVINYRDQIDAVYKRLTEALEDETLEGLHHTGKIHEDKMDGFQKAIRYLISPTKLIFVLPFILFLVWLKIYCSIKTC